MAPIAASPAFSQTLIPSCSAADLGARGDDETDDGDALQKAIDQCAVVHVPPGRYLVSPQGAAAFGLNVPAGRSIIGDDRDTTTFVQTVAGPSARLLQVSGAGLTISGLTLDGSKGDAGPPDSDPKLVRCADAVRQREHEDVRSLGAPGSGTYGTTQAIAISGTQEGGLPNGTVRVQAT